MVDFRLTIGGKIENRQSTIGNGFDLSLN